MQEVLELLPTQLFTKSTNSFLDPSTHFPPGEYLLVDSAYGVSIRYIPPYRSAAADLPERVKKMEQRKRKKCL
jgi:hypothetical protein